MSESVSVPAELVEALREALEPINAWHPDDWGALAEAAIALVDAVPTAKGDAVTDDTAAVQAGAPVVGGWVERPSEDETCNYGAHFAGCEHEVAAPAGSPSEPLCRCGHAERHHIFSAPQCGYCSIEECDGWAPVPRTSISDEAETFKLTDDEMGILSQAVEGWTPRHADDAMGSTLSFVERDLVAAIESIIAARLDRATKEDDRG